VKKRVSIIKFVVYLAVLVMGGVLFYLYMTAPKHGVESGPFYIKVDGVVEPSTASIRRSGDVYTFTSNVHGPVIVEKDNVVVDGAGFTVQGSGVNGSKGVYLSGRKNVTLRNMGVTGFWYGVCLANSSGISVLGTNVTENVMYGVWLNEYSSRNIVSWNGIAVNGHGICVEYCSENVFSGNSIVDNGFGVYLYYSSNNSFSGNNVTANGSYGFWLHESSNFNSISGNSIVENGVGIYFLRLSEFNSISGNNITANERQGIWLHQSSNNILSGNSIVSNRYGLYLSLGFIGGSSDNLVYHNNFVGNVDQVFIENATGTHEPPPPPVNVWDNGFEGNFWSEYVDVDKNRDGIGDSPYLVTSLKVTQYDHYPLMGSFYGLNVSGYDVAVVSNSTIEGFDFFKSNSTIKIFVSKMAVNQTFGFCRIRVPHSLVNETFNVDVEGAETYYVNYALHDDGENRWVYVSYQHWSL